MKKALLFIFSAGLTIMPSAASAASTALAPNTTTTTFNPITGVPASFQLLADTGDMSFTGYNASQAVVYTGTADAQAYMDPSTGYVDFFYEVTDSTGDPLERVTMTDFTGYQVAVNYLTGSNTVAPTYASLAKAGDTVGFSFASGIQNGETAWLEIDTNATSYRGGTLNLEDGGIATMMAFSPAPEPSSLGLLGAALTGLGLLQFKLRRKA